MLTTFHAVLLVSELSTIWSVGSTTTLTFISPDSGCQKMGSMTLPDINEDDANSAGTAVAAIIASAGGDRITDPEDPRHGVIGLSTAETGDAEAWNVLESALTLCLEAGRVLSLDDLITRVWGAEFIGEPQVVYVHIRWLREKIEEDPNKPKRIVNVRGVGYKLVPQSD
jgi:hypothetical protein